MDSINSTQSIFKKVKHDSKFAQISNELINNRNLSYKSLGILIYILSKPDDWTVYISDLIRDNKDGEKSVRSGVNELIENKYMQRYRVYDADTKKVHHWETLVSETPFDDNNLISIVREKYLRDSEGNIVYQKIKFGEFERITPIVIERDVELLSQKGKIGTKKLLSQNVQVAKVQVENEGQQILDNTNTDFNENLNSSSSTANEERNIIDEFENNICKLQKTTKIKFKELVKNHNFEMIVAVIEECNITNVKSYKGFEVAFISYIKRNCKTKEDVIKAAAEFRDKKKKNYKKTNSINTSKELKFNNFEPRDYNYNVLEKKLLGWDESEENESIYN